MGASRRALSVSLRSLVATASFESSAACWGRLIWRDRTSTVVSFCAFTSLRPTLCFFLAKSWLPLPLAGRLMPLPMLAKVVFNAKQARHWAN